MEFSINVNSVSALLSNSSSREKFTKSHFFSLCLCIKEDNAKFFVKFSFYTCHGTESHKNLLRQILFFGTSSSP